MKNKQVMQGAALGALFFVLIIVAVLQFRGTPPPPPSPRTATPPPPSTQPVAATTVAQPGSRASGVGWVEDARVPRLVAEVAGGRDPFKNLLEGRQSTPVVSRTPPTLPTPPPLPILPSTVDQVPGTVGSPAVPAIAPLLPLQTTVTLEWITPQELAVAFRQQTLAVELISQGGARVSIKGYDPDYSRAQELVRTLDVPPPVPNFVIVGVAISGSDRFATLKVNGTAYTVAEGRAIPGIGWSVTAITAKTVFLTNGKQSVQLRFSGGSSS